ncbi:MAG TPA: hypothetical protein VFW71_02125 [Actinomycetota bacterium]|nr:hypothetical protein [Actinomycetota bacterium]
MSPRDGCPHEMDDVTRMSDTDIERLLTGKAPLGGEDAPDLTSFFADLKSRYVADPPPAVRQAHLAQMFDKLPDAARLPITQQRTQQRPTPRPGTDTGTPGRPPWRRKVVFSSLFGTLTAKILAGVVAAAAATGGLAAAGALPAPVQNIFSAAAGNPTPAVSASAGVQLEAEEHQAQQVASTVGSLIDQVNANAGAPSKITSAALDTAGTCTQNVTSLAGDLVHDIDGVLTSAGAQSLAARATALAQESIGCALPNGTTVSSTVKVPPVISNAASTIATAIQGCSAPLKSAIETLVQAAIKAKTSAEIQALGQDAKAVASAAQACASALAGALKSLAPTLPKIPTSTVGNPLSGLLSLVPNLPKLPGITGGTSGGAGVTATVPNPASLFDPSAWLKLLSSLPKGFTGSAGVTGTAGTTSGSGWTGITGSWNTGGSWNPFTGSASGSVSGSTGTTTHTGHH